MKRFLWLLLIVPLGLFAQTIGRSPAFLGAAVPAAGGSGWSCTDADILCERFANGYDDAGWVESGEGGTSTINESFADYPAGTCDSANVKCLKFTRNDGVALVSSNSMTAAGTVYGLCWFKITRASAATTATSVMVHNGTSANTRMSVGYTNAAGGDLCIVLSHYAQDSSIKVDYYTGITIGVWHKMEWMWIKNQSSEGISFTLDGNAQTVSDTSTRDDTLKDIRFQVVDGLSVTLSVDNIKLSSSAAPICAP